MVSLPLLNAYHSSLISNVIYSSLTIANSLAYIGSYNPGSMPLMLSLANSNGFLLFSYTMFFIPPSCRQRHDLLQVWEGVTPTLSQEGDYEIGWW